VLLLFSIIQGLEQRILKLSPSSHLTATPRPRRAALGHFRTFLLARLESNARHVPRSESLLTITPIEEPFVGAWLSEGDIAEIFEDGYWYFGWIQFVNAYGQYVIVYADKGQREVVDRYSIRPLRPYEVGEKVEVKVRDEYFECSILRQDRFPGGETYGVIFHGTGEYRESVTVGDLRRPGERLRTKHEFYSDYHN
jgi:hypothetical protein